MGMILQARILEWVACPSPGNLPDPGSEPVSPASPALQAGSLPTEPPGKPGFHFGTASIDPNGITVA